MSEHIPGRRTSTGAAKLVRFAGAGGLLEIGPGQLNQEMQRGSS